jgi:PAS domain S-box-containing protein
MLLETSDNTTALSQDLILLLNQTPQNINVAQYEGINNNGLHCFRIIFLNSHSLKTPESSYFLGKTLHEANPFFLQNGVYEKLIEVYESGISQTLTYEIDFFGTLLTIESLVVKMGPFLISYSQDITPRLNKEHLLIAKNQVLNDAHKLLEMGTWELDLTTKLITSNFNIGGFFELPNNDYTITLEQYYDFLFTENLSDTIQNFNSLIERGEAFFLERRYITQSGKDKYLEITGKPIFDKSVCNKVIGTFRDITKRKHYELDLAKNELILNGAKQLLKMCTWSYNPDTQKSIYSKELSEILEYETPIELNSFDEYLEHIHPDYKNTAKENFNKTISTSEYNFKADRKVLTKKGNTKFIEIVGQSIIKGGKVKRVFGTIRDITEKKIKDIQLLESEKQLIAARSLLTMGSVRFDYKNDVYYISEELSYILEFDKLQPFNKFEDWWSFVAPEEKEESKQNFSLSKIEPLSVVEKIERKFISKKGNVKYVEFLFEANTQQPYLFTGTFRDITENKLKDLKLLEKERELIEARKLLKMGSFYFDFLNNKQLFSKEMSELLEYDEAFEITDFEIVKKHYAEEDKYSSSRLIDATKNGKVLHAKEERKVITEKGNIKYFEFIAENNYENNVLVYGHGTFRDITEKKLSDLIILESELRLKNAHKLSKMATWQIDIKTQRINFSEEVVDLFDNKLKTSLRLEDYFKLNSASDEAPFKEKFYSHFNQKNHFKTINHFLFEDGSSYFVEIIGRYLDDAEMVGTIRDITEQYKIDEALKESEERYKLLFDHNPTMYFTIDESNKLLSVNQFSLDYLGFKLNEVINENFTLLYPEEEEKKAIRNVELLKHSYSNFWQWEILKKKKNGSVFWAKETGRVAKNKAGKNIYLIISEDISEEVENRELIKTKQKELIQAKNAAEAAAKEKQQFASIMSHEIRSPLNAVIGITNLLLLEDPKPEQIEELNTLKFAGENLLMLVNDILDFNKIEAGKLQLEKTVIQLKSLVKNLHNTFQYKANEKNITLRSNVDNDLPETVLGDPTRIAQILTNLLSNAIKFTENGFVELSLRKMKSTEDGFVKVRFEVADSGIGIPKNKHHLIFESFSQANTDTNRKFGGTGLGLTITKKLIQLHKSEIYLQSEEGKGTTFYFDLLFEIDNNITFNESGKNIKTRTKDLVGKKVLLVEDNAFNQLIAVKFLEKWEAKVDVADNGLIALKKIEANSYDLILMDIQMPEMNGIECTHAIRKSNNEKIKNLPIIAFTAAADTETDKMIAEGMNDSISKPFNPDELFKKILNNLI